MSYKNIIENFDINIDKSMKEDNEYLFITNDSNRLIYLSHPIKKKYKNQLLSKNNIKLFEGHDLNFNGHIITLRKNDTNIHIDFHPNILDYKYTTNGLIIASNTIKGSLFFDNDSLFRCNDKCMTIVGCDNIPLLIMNPLYNVSNNSYDKCYIEYEKIDNNHVCFEVKSNHQNKLYLEIIMYSNKLIYDTIIEKSHKDRNNIYSPLIFLNYDEEVEELLLRINYLPLSNLIGKKIKESYLYLPIIDLSTDVQLNSYKIKSKWCSFNTTWNNVPHYKTITNKIQITDKYVKVDITDYIVNIANLKDIYNPGLVISCEQGKMILSTADSYYYPNLIEVILNEQGL